MMKVTVRVPLRADLAGGTLDLWPLYLFHPTSRTVNVAIGIHAECEVSRTDDEKISLLLSDAQYERSYASIQEMKSDPKVSLLTHIVEHFNLTGVRIVTRTDAPRGSGLGGSSALAVALVRACSEVAEAPVEGEELITLVRDLETRLLGLPAGVQDYYPPVYGGLSALHLVPGRIARHAISLPVAELARHFVLHYSDISHFSGTNNWEIYRRHIDGDREVFDGLEAIAQLSLQMERALEGRDVETAGKVLLAEWNARKALIRGISTPEIDAAVEAALGAGAWGAKVCGAGGGGCIVMLGPADKRDAIVAALRRVPGRTLDAVPVANGLTLESSEEQASFTFVRRSRSISSGEPLEQLYLRTSDDGPYRPHVLAEGSITYDDPRIGVHHIDVRALVAPIDVDSLTVDWNAAIDVNPEKLALAAVPDSGKRTVNAQPKDVALAASESEEAFRNYLQQSHRFTLWHNPALGLYSTAHEDRESFLERCLEQARTEVDESADRLESTFRRRIDQMREQSERHQRAVEANTDEESPERRAAEVGFSWSQALYNITTGRPATTEEPQSVSEADYLGKIGQLQKAWERELDSLKEEQEARAREIEEITLTPALRNVETLKYVVLWASSLENV